MTIMSLLDPISLIFPSYKGGDTKGRVGAPNSTHILKKFTYNSKFLEFLIYALSPIIKAQEYPLFFFSYSFCCSAYATDLWE